MKITKSQLKRIIKEELEKLHDQVREETTKSYRLEKNQKANEVFSEGGAMGHYPGAGGPSTAHMTIGEVEEVVARAGIQGLMYGHAKELMEALDRANINRREFEEMLRSLPRHTKTTGRPYSALSWIHQQIG